MTKFTGYGRAWSEPLAENGWPRIRQIMREPAGRGMYIALAVVIILAALFTPVVLAALS